MPGGNQRGMRTFHRLLLLTILIAGLMVGGTAQAQPAASPHGREEPDRAAAPPRPTDADRLLPDATTHHTLELAGRTLHFAATAGAIRLTDDKGAPQTDVAFVAYRLEDADPVHRPVTFVFNGGPGMASGWLQVGALGPWRVRLDGDAGTPSASPVPLPNQETWLDFTDLVFLDPPGTGYSRIFGGNEDARKRFWSVDGDVRAMGEAIHRWLDRNDRIVSPKYLVGESYGGIRGPRLARRLQSDEGIGISGMVLISPLLDVNRGGGFQDPMSWVDRLPSQVAAARARRGPVVRDQLAEAEAYATTGYLADLLRGERDSAAIARVSERVAALTGLDPALVRRFHGRLDNDVILHELDRANGRVASVYDATTFAADPFPHRAFSSYPDPVLEGFKAPVTSAMMALYSRLGWRPEGVYYLANESAFYAWDWGRGMSRPESVSALSAALALDPHMKVLVTHGLFDLRTPYFASVLILNQMPDLGGTDRVQFRTYSGGHMFYSNDTSRADLRADAAKLYQP